MLTPYPRRSRQRYWKYLRFTNFLYELLNVTDDELIATTYASKSILEHADFVMLFFFTITLVINICTFLKN